MTMVLLAPVFTGNVNAQEELVFQERFINPAGENVDFSSLGWTALIFDPDNADPDNLVDISTLDGQPSAGLAGVTGNIGYETCFCDDDLGHVFLWTGAKTTEYALMYEDVTIDRSQMEITRVNWYVGVNPSGEATFWQSESRFMLKIGGQWYATTDIYLPQSGEENTWEQVQHTFSTEGADWVPVSAEANAPLELGDPLSASLPSGNIEGVGFYLFHPPLDGSAWLDELEIYAEPSEGGEPSQWAGYDIVVTDGLDYINTEGWMGWLDVTTAPWNYSLSLESWIYLEEAAAGNETGAWMYVIK